MKWNLSTITAGLAGCCLLAGVCYASEPVNINEADATTIAERLNGIGPVKARAIVEYRDLNGQFDAVEQLQMVEGIGESLFEKVKPYLLVGEGENTDSDSSNKMDSHQLNGAAGNRALPDAGMKPGINPERSS